MSGQWCRRERKGKKREYMGQLRRKRRKLEVEKGAGHAVGVVQHLSEWKSWE